MTLFHASTSVYSAGDVVSANGPTRFYPDAIELLEADRNPSRPSRSVCVFAAESVAAATAFLDSQLWGKPDEIHVYEVAMSTHDRGPFAVIHELAKRLKSGHPTGALVREYWNPTNTWVFWEVFGPSLQVIAEVPQASEADVIRFKSRYESDLKCSPLL